MATAPVKNEKWLLLTLAGMLLTHILDFMIMMPLGPQLIRSLGITTQQFGVLLACYTFSAAISSLLASSFIDKFDRRTTFLVLYFLFVLATLCCGLASDFYFLMLARVLAGAFGGLIEAMVQTIIADVIPFERRGAAIGKVTGAFAIAVVAGIPLGLFLANVWPEIGWRAPFLFLSVLCAVFFLMAWFFLPILRAHLSSKNPLSAWQNMLSILRNRQLLLALLFVMLLTCGGFLVTPFMSLYLTGNVGIAESTIPTIYFCAGFATLISSRMIGKLADQHGKQRVYRWIALATFAPLLIATHMPKTAFVWVLLNCIALFVLVPGRMIAAMGFLTQLPPINQRGTFMSLFSAVQMFSIGISTSLTANLISRDSQGQILYFGWVGMLAVVMGALSIFLLPFLQPKNQL